MQEISLVTALPNRAEWILSLILVIDDNLDLLNVVTMALEIKGHRVFTAGNGPTGLELFRQHHPDLVILDIMMPGMSGWEVCQHLREASSVPILFLTILGQEQDVVRGLRGGADGYMIKPFAVRELVGRVHALLRRDQMARKRQEQPVFVGDWVLKRDSREVVVGDRSIKLTPVECRLLHALIEQVGKVVSHDELLSAVWGEGHKADIQQLKVYIYYLRKKLEKNPRKPRHILSERGQGYRLVI